MASKKITAMPNLAGGQVSTDLATLVDLSAAVANQNAKSTLNDLFSIISKNLTDGALRFQGTFNPALSAANQGSFFYNDITDTFQGSRNGSAYQNFLFGSGITFQVAYWGTLIDELKGHPGFTYNPDSITEAKLIQQDASHTSLYIQTVLTEILSPNIVIETPVGFFDGYGKIEIDASGNTGAGINIYRNSPVDGDAASITIEDANSVSAANLGLRNNLGRRTDFFITGSATGTSSWEEYQNTSIWYSTAGNGINIGNAAGNNTHIGFYLEPAGVPKEMLRIEYTGSLIQNAEAIATNATDGFFYIVSAPGAPTGTPTTYTGRVPLVIDSAGSVLYAYIGGAWKGLQRQPVSAVATTPRAVLATESDNIFSNEGAAAQIEFTLPGAAASLAYTFIVQDADGIKITAAGGDTIRFGGTVTGAGGNITSTTIGSSITLVAINTTEWMATSVVGTWA